MTESQFKILQRLSRESYPFEGCALLLGFVKKNLVEVIDIIPSENKERSRVAFQIDPKSVFEAYQRADREGKEVVGVFHSHSDPPRPSLIDIQYMQVNPIVWLILSTKTKKIEAYQIYEESVKQVRILCGNTGT